MKTASAMEHPMNGNGNGGSTSTLWVMLFGLMAGMAKWFDSYLLADSFFIATFKAGMAGGFVVLCGGIATVLNTEIIKPFMKKKIEKFKRKNKPL